VIKVLKITLYFRLNFTKEIVQTKNIMKETKQRTEHN